MASEFEALLGWWRELARGARAGGAGLGGSTGRVVSRAEARVLAGELAALARGLGLGACWALTRAWEEVQAEEAARWGGLEAGHPPRGRRGGG